MISRAPLYVHVSIRVPMRGYRVVYGAGVVSFFRIFRNQFAQLGQAARAFAYHIEPAEELVVRVFKLNVRVLLPISPGSWHVSLYSVTLGCLVSYEDQKISPVRNCRGSMQCTHMHLRAKEYI